MGIPALLGLLLAAGVFAALGLPALGRLAEQRQRLSELESKQDSLPLLEAQLKQSDQAVAEVMQQQALLVDLVAGRGQIQTFLAQLSRLSAASGVVINRYEPVPASTPAASNRSGRRNQNKKGADKTKSVNDPLQALGYEKSSVLLQVEGPYQGLLQFLRGMEQLELLVQPSDLELTALEDPADDVNQSGAIGMSRTQLKLKLSFFDHLAKSGDGASDDLRSFGMSGQEGNSTS